jgi:hypothetical protein
MDRLRAARGSEELAAAASAPEFPQLVAGIAATLPQLPPDASLHRVLLGPTCFEEVVDGGVFVLDAVARRHGPETAAALDAIVKRVYQHGHKLQAPRADVFVATAAYLRPPSGANNTSEVSRVTWDTGFTAPANDVVLTVMPDASPPKWVTTIETMLSSVKSVSDRGVAARRELGPEATRAAIERATVELFAADGDAGQADQRADGWTLDWDPSALACHTEKRTLNVDGDPVDPALTAPLSAWRSPLPPVDTDLAVAEVREARSALLDNAADLFKQHFGSDEDDDDDEGSESQADSDDAAVTRTAKAGALQQQLADDVDLFAPHLSSPSKPTSSAKPMAAVTPDVDTPLTEAEREARIAKMRALPVAPQLTPMGPAATATSGAGTAGIASSSSVDGGPSVGGDGVDDVAFATKSDAIVFIGGKLQLKPKRQPKPKPAPKPKAAGKRLKPGTVVDADAVEGGAEGKREQPAANSRAQPADGADEDVNEESAVNSLEAALSQLPAAVRTAAMIGLLSRDSA